MKRIAIFITVFIIVFAPISSVYCAENTTAESLLEELYKELDLDSFINYTASQSFYEMFGYSTPMDFFKAILNGEQIITFEVLWEAFKNAIGGEISALTALTLQVVILAALCGLIQNMSSSFFSEKIKNSAFFAIYIALGAILMKTFFGAISECTGVVFSLVEFMNTAVPILIVLLSTNGGILSAGLISPTLLFFANLITYLINSLIIPVMSFAFILNFSENLLDGINISYLTKFIKKGCSVVLGICFTVFSAIIALEGITFASIDGVSIKAIKYAASSLVPVIGSFLSNSFDTVSGFMVVIKNTVGLLGILIIISIAFIPAIKLFAVFLALRLSSILVQPFAEKRFSSLVDEAASCMLFITMCVIIVGVMFIIMIALFLMLGNYVFLMR